MTSSARTLFLCVLSLVIIPLALVVHGAVTISPAAPTVLAGQSVQLTANGVVVPTAIATGAGHSCVLFSDQSVRCTGQNNQGEVGNNTFSNVFEPAVAIGTVNPVTLRTGLEHTCTLVGDGRMQCWGTNFTGQLGDGTMGGFAMTPQFVHNMTTAIKLVTGGFHTCAIMPDRTAQCWGRNQDGQLGNGDSTTDVPLPAPVQGLGPVADLIGGGYHNCALIGDGTARCWGRNDRGQVGNGTAVGPVTQPQPVSGLTTAAALSLGTYHSCALLQSGAVQCWGQSDFGQIGVPGITFSATPATVNGIGPAAGIYTGFMHSCAVLTDGTVWCWGRNDFGQLGDGTTASTPVPVQARGIVNPRMLGLGMGHTCALLQDLSVQCWGEGDLGEFGAGTATNSPTPVKMHGTGLTWTSSNASVATVSASGLVTGVASGTATITVADGSGNTGSTTVTVGQMFALSVARQGDGTGSVTSAPAGLNCPSICSAQFQGGTTVTLTATAAASSLFSGWTGCDSVSGASCTVSMTAARSVTATFRQLFALSVVRQGDGTGSITSAPAGVNCPTTCSAQFLSGSTVTLTAVAAADSLFASWTGCDSVSGASCTVSMAAARSVTATFRQLFALTVTRQGDGTGTVTSAPAGVNCPTTCAAQFLSGSTVTLTAAPAANSLFTGWTGCDSVSGASCTVSLTAARSVTATFMLKRFTLTVSTAGLGKGTVTSSPAGISCGTACKSDFVIGTTVTLTAHPGTLSLFQGWTGCDSTNGTTCTVTMGVNKSVSASFIGVPLL